MQDFAERKTRTEETMERPSEQSRLPGQCSLFGFCLFFFSFLTLDTEPHWQRPLMVGDRRPLTPDVRQSPTPREQVMSRPGGDFNTWGATDTHRSVIRNTLTHSPGAPTSCVKSPCAGFLFWVSYSYHRSRARASAPCEIRLFPSAPPPSSSLAQ